MDLMISDANVTYMIDIMRENGNKIIRQADAAAKKAGMHAETKTIESVGGRIAALIVSEAAQWPADLIVIGTHGLRGFSRLIMGSDAEYVVRNCDAPVLLVKNRVEES